MVNFTIYFVHNVCYTNTMNLKLKRFNQHARDASIRGIPFLLTYEEWCYIWDQSGHWDQRGRGPGKYCMSRIGDTGPYAVGNVYINLFSENSRDAHKGKPKTYDVWNKGIPMRQESKDKLTIVKTGKPSKKKGIPQPKVQCPHCLRWGGTAFKYYHFDRCPLIDQYLP